VSTSSKAMGCTAGCRDLSPGGCATEMAGDSAPYADRFLLTESISEDLSPLPGDGPDTPCSGSATLGPSFHSRECMRSASMPVESIDSQILDVLNSCSGSTEWEMGPNNPVRGSRVPLRRKQFTATRPAHLNTM
jgi:hypothetical protein